MYVHMYFCMYVCICIPDLITKIKRNKMLKNSAFLICNSQDAHNNTTAK